MKKGMTYRDAGVDIEAGEEAVERIRQVVKGTHRPEVLGGIGGFGGFFAFDCSRYRNPVLVSGADGVGTKLKVAFQAGIHDTVGIDAVAMCVNDIVVSGAEPLFFLDYLAVGKMDPDQVAAVVKGLSQGCREAGCALIGGETAEMPGFYPAGEYDLAGFAVGVVEQDRVITGVDIAPGDVLLGLASSGIHSNGFSLARKVLFEKAGYRLDQGLPDLGRTLAEELLEPTRIYVKPLLKVFEEFSVKGVAHITGGGVPGNLVRILPEGCGAVLHRGTWEVPAIFALIQREGAVSEEEMFRTFNMGIGMVLVVTPEEAGAVAARLQGEGERVFSVGRVIQGERRVLVR